MANRTGATTPPLVERGTRLAEANVHSTDDKNLIVDATSGRRQCQVSRQPQLPIVADLRRDTSLDDLVNGR